MLRAQGRLHVYHAMRCEVRSEVLASRAVIAVRDDDLLILKRDEGSFIPPFSISREVPPLVERASSGVPPKGGERYLLSCRLDVVLEVELHEVHVFAHSLGACAADAALLVHRLDLLKLDLVRVTFHVVCAVGHFE